MSVEIFVGDPGQIGPQDPPYLPQVVFPSGMRLDLVPAAELTVTYPTPAGNPFGSGFTGHYERVGFFIDLDRAPVGERISENFRLSEFVAPTLERGGRLAYVDAQMAQHVQTIRSGLGRPLILTSAFRSPIHNQSAGGATFSRHIYGDAVDIDVDQSRSDAEVRAQEIFNEALDAGVDFVLPLSETSVTVNGVSRVSWVHLDDRGF
ncbi:MAG: D-Ala-D-Ala carboxypeptidase family metallohydrolase [bacterium]|nr:D-Ala-D-Ala carboxypeptidase family metallohydrolase [bacterium]